MITKTKVPLFGRGKELDRIDSLLETAETAPAALFLVGEAGIGKTSLWREGLTRAMRRGFRVFKCAPAKPEQRLAYSALSDLLADISTGELAELPEVQRCAMEVALLKATPGHLRIEQSAVAMGMLSLLSLNANERPLLIALDDLQWIDDETASVMTFALRRISKERVGLLVTHRSGEPDPLALDHRVMSDAEHVEIDPLTLEEFDALLQNQLPQKLSFPQVAVIYRACSGNPLLGTELARSAVAGRLKIDPGRPLKLPRHLDRLVVGHLLNLSPDVLRLLGAAAALSRPTIDELEALDSRATTLLFKAEQAGVISADAGRIRFSHPLLGSAAYSRMSSRARRSLHSEIARVIADPEENARHLALATEGPDESVALVLEDAAEHALSRGAPNVAADMLEEAARLTPREDLGRVGLRQGLAGCHQIDAGRVRRGVELLDAAVPLVRGTKRALLLRHRALAGDLPAKVCVDQMAEAITDAQSDPTLQTRILIDLSWNLTALMRFADAEPCAQRAVKSAEQLSNSQLLASALAAHSAVSLFRSGQLPDEEIERSRWLQRISATEAGLGGRPPGHPQELQDSRWLCGLTLLWGDRLDRARPLFAEMLQECAVAGQEAGVSLQLWFLSIVEFRHGDWETARLHARRCAELEARQYGDLPIALGGTHTLALLDACTGDLDVAEAAALRGLRGARHVDAPFVELQFLSALAFIAHVRADASAVIDYVDELPTRIAATGLVDPGLFRFEHELVEAHLLLGNRTRADSLISELEVRADKVGGGWTKAAALRCRGLFLSGEGELRAGLAKLEDSVAAFAALGQPFERGRSLLTLGEAQRRARRKTDARISLDRAHSTFSCLGATAWAAKARGAAARIGGRSASRELTPTESQVASLVAGGRTNREVAAAMSVSPKTVEWTLSNVYRKLQVRSRTELANRFRNSQLP